MYAYLLLKIGYKVATDKCISTNLIQDNQEIDDYYNLLDTVVTDIFVPNNISYWLIGGSLIGSIRSRPPGKNFNYSIYFFYLTFFFKKNRSVGT